MERNAGSACRFALHTASIRLVASAHLAPVRASFIVSDNMNLGWHKIEIQCPGCGFYNEVFLKQVRHRDIIICRGCKANIHLDDQMNECRKAIRSINQAIRQLEDLQNTTLTIQL